METTKVKNLRIAGVNLNPRKVVLYEITKKVFGIGLYRATQICKKANILQNTRIQDLNTDQSKAIFSAIEELKYSIGDELSRSLISDQRRLASIRCYRAKRKEKGLPCRGQRTCSNGKTAKKKLNRR